MTRNARSRILFSTRCHAMDRNPYIQQLAQHLRDSGLHVDAWTWRTALLRRYDVLHVHWPEYIVSHRRGWLARVNAVLSTLLLLRLRLQQTPVVRTVHNDVPHFAMTRGAQWRTHKLDASTVHHIQLHKGVTNRSDTVILHGHYSDWFARYPHSAPVPGRFLFFGLIRPYKNVPALVEAFKQVPDSDASLSIVGEPESDSGAAELISLTALDSRIDLDLAFASEDVLARHITSASVVVLPYSNMFNSGAALLALSLGRRVLVADSPSMRSLAAEVGSAWVRTFDGAISDADLVAAMEYPGSTEPPDLTEREWTRAARAHRDVYMRAMAHPRGKGI